MQKVDARKWNFSKESFQEYAMYKLKLLHILKLPERERVALVINGIKCIFSSNSYRIAATIDNFLDSMFEILKLFRRFF